MHDLDFLEATSYLGAEELGTNGADFRGWAVEGSLF